MPSMTAGVMAARHLRLGLPHWARHCGYTNRGQNLCEGGGDEASSALSSDEVAQLEKLFLA